MMRNLKLALAVVPFVAVLACTDANKAPAEQALRNADSAVTKLDETVTLNAPEQAKAAKDALAAAKSAAGKQDWKAALSLAGDVPGKVAAAVGASQTKIAEDAKKAAEAKKVEEAKKAWADASAAFPKSLNDLKTKASKVIKATKLPKGVDKAAVKKAKDTLAAIEAGWKSAVDLAKTDVAAAAAKVSALEAQAAEVRASLHLK